MEFHYTTHVKFEQLEKDLFDNYNLLDAFLLNINNVRNLKKKKDRTCRFCNKSYPVTKFKSKSHLIPRFLGNDNMLSDFECDKCNNNFGKMYENELMKFLGISPTIHYIRNKKKDSTFKAPGDKIRVEKGNLLNLQGINISILEDGQSFEFDEITGECKKKYKKHSFIPRYVYKAFLKIAISLLSPDEINTNYKTIIRILASNSYDDKYKGCHVFTYDLPLTYCFRPHALLYEKKDNNFEAPTHIFQFYFLNFIFELPMPFNLKDSRFNGKQIIKRRCPPLFLSRINCDNLDIVENYYDLTSTELKVGTVEILSFQFKEDKPHDLVPLNLDTLKINSNLSFGNNITSIFISDNSDESLDLKK